MDLCTGDDLCLHGRVRHRSQRRGKLVCNLGRIAFIDARPSMWDRRLHRVWRRSSSGSINHGTQCGLLRKQSSRRLSLSRSSRASRKYLCLLSFVHSLHLLHGSSLLANLDGPFQQLIPSWEQCVVQE